MSSKLKVAVVCSSNMNRSMESHSVLSKRNFLVSSYGTGEKIKIPGKSSREPNVYPFGTTYEEIHKDLVSKDKQLYTGTIKSSCLLRMPQKADEISQLIEIS